MKKEEKEEQNYMQLSWYRGQIAERCTIGYFQALDTSNGRKFPPNELLSMFLVPMERIWVGLSENIYFYELLYIFLEDMSLKTSKIG